MGSPNEVDKLDMGKLCSVSPNFAKTETSPIFKVVECMIRITKPSHYLKVEVEEMTIGGSDRNFFPPGEMPCSPYTNTFCDYSSPVLAFFPFFSHAYPMAVLFFTGFASPGAPPDPGKFRRAPHAGHWRRLEPGYRNPATGHRNTSAKLTARFPCKSLFRS